MGSRLRGMFHAMQNLRGNVLWRPAPGRGTALGRARKYLRGNVLWRPRAGAGHCPGAGAKIFARQRLVAPHAPGRGATSMRARKCHHGRPTRRGGALPRGGRENATTGAPRARAGHYLEAGAKMPPRAPHAPGRGTTSRRARKCHHGRPARRGKNITCRAKILFHDSTAGRSRGHASPLRGTHATTLRCAGKGKTRHFTPCRMPKTPEDTNMPRTLRRAAPLGENRATRGKALAGGAARRTRGVMCALLGFYWRARCVATAPHVRDAHTRRRT